MDKLCALWSNCRYSCSFAFVDQQSLIELNTTSFRSALVKFKADATTGQRRPVQSALFQLFIAHLVQLNMRTGAPIGKKTSRCNLFNKSKFWQFVAMNQSRRRPTKSWWFAKKTCGTILNCSEVITSDKRRVWEATTTKTQLRYAWQTIWKHKHFYCCYLKALLI